MTLLLVAVAGGCSSSTTNGGTGGGGGQTATGGAGGHTATGGAGGHSATGGVGGAATSGFTLTIQDYLSWCNVTENGTAFAPATVYPAGTVVNLMGTTASTMFVWGYWVGTDGDTTASHDTNMTTTVTMTSNKVVQACCPLTAASTTPCPAPTP